MLTPVLLKVIHQNLLLGGLFVIAFMIMAGLQVITPITGAILHLVGATFVIFNSARLVKMGEGLHLEEQEEAAVQPKVERVVASPQP